MDAVLLVLFFLLERNVRGDSIVGSQGCVRVLRAGAGLGSSMAIQALVGQRGAASRGGWARGARAGRPSGARLAGAQQRRGQARAQACGGVGLSGHGLGHGGCRAHRLCPHTWWCFSQSLCWQKEPQ